MVQGKSSTQYKPFVPRGPLCGQTQVLAWLLWPSLCPPSEMPSGNLPEVPSPCPPSHPITETLSPPNGSGAETNTIQAVGPTGLGERAVRALLAHVWPMLTLGSRDKECL